MRCISINHCRRPPSENRPQRIIHPRPISFRNTASDKVGCTARACVDLPQAFDSVHMIKSVQNLGRVFRLWYILSEAVGCVGGRALSTLISGCSGPAVIGRTLVPQGSIFEPLFFILFINETLFQSNFCTFLRIPILKQNLNRTNFLIKFYDLWKFSKNKIQRIK